MFGSLFLVGYIGQQGWVGSSRHSSSNLSGEGHHTLTSKRRQKNSRQRRVTPHIQPANADRPTQNTAIQQIIEKSIKINKEKKKTQGREPPLSSLPWSKKEMKGKAKRSKVKLGLQIVVLLCFLFLLAGFFGSTLLSPVYVCACIYMIFFVRLFSGVDWWGWPRWQGVPRVSPRLRGRELVDGEEDELTRGLMPHGRTGEAFVKSIPFQVCSSRDCPLFLSLLSKSDWLIFYSSD